MQVVVYMGGCCGDFITALIDAQGVVFDDLDARIVLPEPRQRLKKFWQFDSNSDKDRYMDAMSAITGSISSHDIEYHCERPHDIIGVAVENEHTASWAAARFQRLHRPQVWQQVCQSNGIKTVGDYAQLMLHYSDMLTKRVKRVITVEQIRRGGAPTWLEQQKIDLDATASVLNQRYQEKLGT